MVEESKDPNRGRRQRTQDLSQSISYGGDNQLATAAQSNTNTDDLSLNQALFSISIVSSFNDSRRILDDDSDDEFLLEDSQIKQHQNQTFLKAPQKMGDFFENAKPLMLEDLLKNETFERTTQAYFDELGHTHIFNIALDWEDSATSARVRDTLDCIYAQLFAARARIGYHYGIYQEAKAGQTVQECFKEFIYSLNWRRTSQDWALHMRNFIEVTEMELEYLESQIRQADYALFSPDGIERGVEWDLQNDPFNCIINLPNHMQNYDQKEKKRLIWERQMVINFLKRVLFKVIVGVERAEYYVTGKIMGRTECLEVLDAKVKDRILCQSQIDPFGPEQLKLSENKEIPVFQNWQDANDRDIMLTYKLQHLIRNEIMRLQRENAQRNCLSEPARHGMEPALLERPFARKAKLERATYQNFHRQNTFEFSELTNWHFLRVRQERQNSRKMKRKEKQQTQTLGPSAVSYANPPVNVRDPQKLISGATRQAHTALIDLIQIFQDTTQADLVQSSSKTQSESLQRKLAFDFFDILYYPNDKPAIYSDQDLQYVFQAFCCSRTYQQQNYGWLTHFYDRLVAMLYSRSKESGIVTPAENLINNLINNIDKITLFYLPLIDAGEIESRLGSARTWYALPSLMILHQKLSRQIGKNGVEFCQFVMEKIMSLLDVKLNDDAKFYLEQNFLVNLPAIIDICTDEFVRNGQAEQMKGIVDFLSFWLCKEPVFVSTDRLSDSFRRKYHLMHDDLVLCEVQNPYVLRFNAMAEILQSRAITRISPKTQDQIAVKFCEFLDKHLDDIRKRQQRAKCLQVMKTSTQNITKGQNEINTSAVIFKFLSGYFKWEYSFYQYMNRSVGLHPSPDSSRLLIGNVDVIFNMANKMPQQFNTKVLNLLTDMVKKPNHPKIILFRLLNSLTSQGISHLFNIRTLDRVNKLLSSIEIEFYKGSFEINRPFRYYTSRFQYQLYANVSLLVFQQLLISLKDQNLPLNQSRSTFATAWFIMLAAAKKLRENERRILIRQGGETKLVECESSYRNGSANLFRMVHLFCHKLKSLEPRSDNLLVPKEEFVERDFKSNYLPQLVSIVAEEARHNIYATLNELLHFLILYQGVTRKIRKKNVNDIRLIDPLIKVVKIAETHLKYSDAYNEHCKRFQKDQFWKNESRLAVLLKRAMRKALGDGYHDGEISEEYEKLFNKFKNIEARIFYTRLHEIEGTQDSFHGVYCKYQLFDVKMQEGILYDLCENPKTEVPDTEVKDLAKAYSQFKNDAKNRLKRDEQASFTNAFLVAEMAFLYREVLDYTLNQLIVRQKVSIANYSSVSFFAKDVVNKLLTQNLAEIMTVLQQPALAREQGRDTANRQNSTEELRETAIQKLMQSNFPLQAAQVKVEEFNRLFFNEQVDHVQRLNEADEIKRLLKELELLYSAVVKRPAETFGLSKPYQAWYFHVSFFGKDLPPELVNQQNGFMFRGMPPDMQPTDPGHGQIPQGGFDTYRIEELFKALFPEVRNLDVVPRDGIDELPQGYKSIRSDQDKPLITFIQQVHPLSKSIYANYSQVSNELQKMNYLQTSQVMRRFNFEKTFDQNFKQQYVKACMLTNQDFLARCDRMIKQKLNFIKDNSEDTNIVVTQADEFSKGKVKNFFKWLLQMMGNHVAEGSPKTAEEFWKKVTDNQPDIQAVKISIVEARAQKIYRDLDQYKDYVLSIFEVPKPFPTGFMMQPLKGQPMIAPISGAAFANLNVRSWLADFKQKMKRLDSPEQLKILHGALKEKLVKGVQNPLMAYTCIFFPKGGFQMLDNSNPQYEDIIGLFNSLDKLLPKMQEALDKLWQANEDENFETYPLQVNQEVLDELFERHHKNFDKLNIQTHKAKLDCNEALADLSEDN